MAFSALLVGACLKGLAQGRKQAAEMGEAEPRRHPLIQLLELWLPEAIKWGP